MRMKNVPDRVHVVRPPQDEAVPARAGQGIEIVRTLAQISDKLKRSEAERYELLSELREYRKALTQLEDKAERAEKAVVGLETKLQTQEKIETDISQRQARFEKALKDTEEKLVSAAAGQALIDKRLKETEDTHIAITQRLDESITEQTRLDRQIEKVTQEKMRVLRKVERLEEITAETQDALRARALVLLTDQSAAVQANLPNMTALARSGETQDHIDISGDQPWWRRSVQMQSLGMASMVAAALLGGWVLNQWQQPTVPQIAVLENGGLARLDLETKRWEAIPAQTSQPENAQTSEEVSTLNDTIVPASGISAEASPENLLAQDQTEAPGQSPDTTQDTTQDTTPANMPLDILNADPAELNEALAQDPDGLAAQLNEIAPQASPDTQAPSVEPEAVKPVAPLSVPGQKALEEKAYRQKSSVARDVAQEKKSGLITDRISADPSLPKMVKAIETSAFGGNAEAQHDLAAIYTAGQGGVAQNFERASLWFRESADNGVSNAMYNLGVLYHQGLNGTKDMNKALYWYREAAKAGHPEAQYNLGIAYIEGIGTDYDPKIAAMFFERAANNGVPEAAYNLGLVYENALLGEANPNEALFWYKKASDGGNRDAASALAQMTQKLQIGSEDVDNIVSRMNKMRAERVGGAVTPTSTGNTPPPTNPVQLLTQQIQEQLKNKGLFKGKTDGILGERTIASIRRYQEQQKLPVDGEVSDALLTHLLSTTP